jgi:hypothetical protein
MDNGNFTMHNGLVTNGWEWVKLEDINLTSGDHTLTIGYREDGAKLDKLVVANYPIPADGMGEQAENLCDPTGAFNSSKVPFEYALAQNYPNPFNPKTTIKYTLTDPGHVLLHVFNLNGQVVETLVDQPRTNGEHQIEWQPKGLASGLYFYRLQVGTASKGSGQRFSETKKLVLQK